MAWIIWVYASITSLVAIWILYAMQKHLDRFDWQYQRDDIWIDLFAKSIFWPIFLIKVPKTLFDVKEMFNFDMGFGDIVIQSFSGKARMLC